MTTPSVLIPDPNQVALDFLRENYPIWFVPNIAQTQRYPVDVVNTIYAALKQAMIATVKEDISDTSKPDDRTQSDLSSSDRTLIAAKEETPQAYKDALRTMPDYKDEEFRNHPHRDIIIAGWFATSCDVVRAALSQSKDGWQIPEGYALVPIEPTDSMIKSGQTCANPYNLFSIWAAMIFACKGK